MKQLILIISLFAFSAFIKAQTPDINSLLRVHTVANDTEMTSLVGAPTGSLVFNIAQGKLFSFSAGGWNETGNNTPKFIEVIDDNASYSIGTTFTKILLDQTRINEGGIFTFGSNEVTINEDGVYEVEYGIGTRTIAWANIEAELRINNSAIQAGELYGGPYNKNNLSTRRMFLTITSGDIISIFARNSDGNSITSIQNASYLLIKKIK